MKPTDKLIAFMTELKAIGASIRNKTGKTEEVGFYQLRAEIDGIQTGGGGVAMELAYETEFSVAETIRTGSKVTVATISTGFNKDNVDIDFAFYCVVKCVNDTETDFSISHFRERSFLIVATDGRYASAGKDGSAFFLHKDGTIKTLYGAGYGLFASAAGVNASSVTLKATISGVGDNWGCICSGDYIFKMYKINHNYFGMEGMK